ncbi:MAG: flagellar assembly peptidoglycan hydrolase FlgJ [Gammaproteobacteria bacterium]|nr:flagellar assembly peptidoglycan hydrolase FlgJ [Gammaproteobacteria bacterium]
MTVHADSARVYTSFEGIAGLRAGARQGRAEATAGVAREFEALFLQMMLSSMRETTFDDSLFGSESMGLYRDLFDKQIARDLAARGDIGIARLLQAQLAETQPGDPPALPAVNAEAGASPFAPRLFRGEARMPAIRGREHVAAPAAGGMGSAGAPSSGLDAVDTPEAFVAAVAPHARTAAGRLGTSAEVLIAQSALETGWGRKVMRRPDGSSSYNMFGIKADASWTGARVRVPTLEYQDGVARRELAEFRAYDSLADSFEDYVRFIEGHPRYAPALEHAPLAENYISALQRAGYATDPGYAVKVVDIMQRLDRPLAMTAMADQASRSEPQ